jgi:membrane protease YdiL (CAAX protease family)
MNTTTTSTSPSETRLGRHTLIWYFALVYAFSWPLWLLSHVAGGTLGTIFIVIGAFGPMLAAAIIISRTGGSVSEWLRSILRWRVSPGYYAYALGLPLLLAVMVNLTLAALGKEPDVSLGVERIPAYLQTLLVTALIFGGQEEPGWRGFALPRLEQWHAPLIATLILGLGLGIWHIPLYGPAGFVVPLVLAFYYTWLCNKTGSVCCASCCMPASLPLKIICC